MLVVGVVAVGVALARPDSPWCSDEADNSCPAEVRYQGRMYVVTCTDPVAASQHGEPVGVVYYDGAKEAERTAWSVDGVPVEQVIVLADQAGGGCPGSEIAYGGSSVKEATALLRP
jgi:hypothetical protein